LLIEILANDVGGDDDLVDLIVHSGALTTALSGSSENANTPATLIAQF
jgi:hypothetical protein